MDKGDKEGVFRHSGPTARQYLIEAVKQMGKALPVPGMRFIVIQTGVHD
jgi:hypothetical protein